jgi:hypothetical protein
MCFLYVREPALESTLWKHENKVLCWSNRNESYLDVEHFVTWTNVTDNFDESE